MLRRLRRLFCAPQPSPALPEYRVSRATTDDTIISLPGSGGAWAVDDRVTLERRRGKEVLKLSVRGSTGMNFGYIDLPLSAALTVAEEILALLEDR